MQPQALVSLVSTTETQTDLADASHRRGTYPQCSAAFPPLESICMASVSEDCQLAEYKSSSRKKFKLEGKRGLSEVNTFQNRAIKRPGNNRSAAVRRCWFTSCRGWRRCAVASLRTRSMLPHSPTQPWETGFSLCIGCIPFTVACHDDVCELPVTLRPISSPHAVFVAATAASLSQAM